MTTPWDWVVTAWREDVLISETVHRGDSSKDLEISILAKRDDLTAINVRRWAMGDPSPLSDWERHQPRTRRRRARITDDVLKGVAEVYRSAWKSSESPTVAVSEHFHISHSSAARRVGQARERGFLGKSDGTRGGEDPFS